MTKKQFIANRLIAMAMILDPRFKELIIKNYEEVVK